QRHALETGAPIPFDLDGDAARTGRHLPLSALRYAIAVRAQLDTGAVEVPEPAFRLSIVVPLLTLLGLSNAPATLDGTIPIPPRATTCTPPPAPIAPPPRWPRTCASSIPCAPCPAATATS